jgi:ribonuclease HI
MEEKELSFEPLLKIWTDGSCHNNGKPDARAGIGVFFNDFHEENVSRLFTLGKSTNQRAELYAIFCALEIVFDKIERGEWWYVNQVIIYTDSAYSIGCLKVWIDDWKGRGWKTTKGKPVENMDIIRPTDKLINSLSLLGIKVLLQKVAGHAGNYGNCQADILANMGANH